MAVPLITKKIVKKHVKQFKRIQSDWKISVKVNFLQAGASSRVLIPRVRRKFKGCVLMPNIGYGSDKKTRNYPPNGFKKFLVHNVKEREILMMHNRLERCHADVDAGSEERADKRPRLDESAVALSLVTSVSLPADKAIFRTEPDLVAIGLAAQSALLAVGRIADMGRRYYDAIELIGRLQAEVEGQRSKAQLEGARVKAEIERARNVEELRSITEKRADVSDDALKLA
ncbi:hypothetical protein CsSME_00053124 [Camellia sinensis var. sinensis]